MRRIIILSFIKLIRAPGIRGPVCPRVPRSTWILEPPVFVEIFCIAKNIFLGNVSSSHLRATSKTLTGLFDFLFDFSAILEIIRTIIKFSAASPAPLLHPPIKYYCRNCQTRSVRGYCYGLIGGWCNERGDGGGLGRAGRADCPGGRRQCGAATR